MPTNYPTSKDDGTSLPTPAASDKTNSPSHSSMHGNENAAIIAIENKLGTGASTPASNTIMFGTGSGTSAWTQLTSAQLLASITDETGTGSLVFATTPTLVTPKMDTIQESTPANGVTIDGLNIKDNKLNTNDSVITANITNAAVTASKLATGAQTAYVATNESTTSTTYADLATTTDSVTVTIGANGLALVSIYCGQIYNNTNGSRSLASFAISGATTQAAADNYSIMILSTGVNTPQIGIGATFLLNGLAAGSTTFKMKYKIVTASTGSFTDRRISVVPL